MRILIHNDEYYPTSRAGAYRMKVLADCFIAAGNKVTILTSTSNKRYGDVTNCKEQIVYASEIEMKKKTTLMRLLSSLSFTITSALSAFRVGKQDLVFTSSPPPLHSLAGWMIAKLRGAKLVYDVRDIWPDVAIEMGSIPADGWMSKVFTLISTFMFRHADLITTVSPGKVENIKAKLPEKMKDKVMLVGNGFNEEVLEQQIDHELVEKYKLKDTFTCIYIGNIGIAQGLDTLLDLAVASKGKEIQFLLFGKGSGQEKLEKRVLDEKLENVKFCGELSHEKVASVLKFSKLSYVSLKSAKMKDTVPTKLYESLGLGCPVLLVAEGDSCDIVERAKLGRHVSPDHLEDVHKVFDEMIQNYDQYAENREYAMQLMKNEYSRQKISAKFEKELQKYA